ncbi:hypothetical protein KW795_00665 [Candidatus Microgenomates bacterium]|nr:hypothetical protein [Candidatus Microgenomates bacterium]
MVQCYIYKNFTIKQLVKLLSQKGGRIDKYYLQDWNKNKHTLVYLNEWFAGKNVREALVKALS